LSSSVNSATATSPDVARSAFHAAVGGTPLVELPSLSSATGHRIFGKCEFLNPNGSVKDRIAVAMIDAAERQGILVPGQSTIVEATAGNTGAALAAVGAARGYCLVVTMSSKMGQDKIALMRAWGAEVVVCPYDVSPTSPDSFINTACRIARERPQHVYIDQFNNPANLDAHYRGTGPEIWRDLDGRIDVLIAGAGTGGTLMGIARFLRSQRLATRIVLADPAGSILAGHVNGERGESHGYLMEGIGGDFVPPLFDASLIDEAITVPDLAAVEMCLRLQEGEGLFVGGSAGCAAAAALTYCQNLEPRGQTVVIMLPDSGRNYLTNIFSSQWRLEKLGMLPIEPSHRANRRPAALKAIHESA
jgi:cystathionine beta-synthase